MLNCCFSFRNVVTEDYRTSFPRINKETTLSIIMLLSEDYFKDIEITDITSQDEMDYDDNPA